MNIFRKEWTSVEADEWTVHDTIAVIISPIIYILILVGASLAIFLVPAGFVALGAGAVLFFVMKRVIDPKLSAVSRGYEKKQKKYIEELEKKIQWED